MDCTGIYSCDCDSCETARERREEERKQREACDSAHADGWRACLAGEPMVAPDGIGRGERAAWQNGWVAADTQPRLPEDLRSLAWRREHSDTYRQWKRSGGSE